MGETGIRFKNDATLPTLQDIRTSFPKAETDNLCKIREVRLMVLLKKWNTVRKD